MRILSGRVLLNPADYRSDDAIQPTQIDHNVEEIYDGKRLQQCYNYIRYEFEEDGAYCWARSYLSEIGKVAIYGPFASRDDLSRADSPVFREAVMAYLKRRYRKIIELSPEGAYTTIWRRAPAD